VQGTHAAPRRIHHDNGSLDPKTLGFGFTLLQTLFHVFESQGCCHSVSSLFGQ
jgi:hypothetical protein